MSKPAFKTMSIPEAARYIGTLSGRKPTVSTIHRWIQKGVRGRKLPSRRLGGLHLICRSDIDAFMASDCAQSHCTSKPTPTPVAFKSRQSHRQHRINACHEELAQKLGLS